MLSLTGIRATNSLKHTITAIIRAPLALHIKNKPHEIELKIDFMWFHFIY